MTTEMNYTMSRAVYFNFGTITITHYSVINDYISSKITL